MSWVSAAALAGIAFVALPLLIHMMGRSPAKTLRFPSLRFLAPSRMLPSRRTRIQDPILLALRALALVLAALALAGPVFDADVPGGGSIRSVAVIVDTSASVGASAGGVPAGEAIAGAAASAVVSTSHPGAAISGAIAWLAAQTGTRELVLVSDFQVGSIDSLDLARIPLGVVVTPRRVAMRPPATVARVVQGGSQVELRPSQRGDTTVASWTRTSVAARPPFEILAGANEAGDVALSGRIASSFGSGLTNAQKPVALVYPNAPARAQLASAAPRLVQRWQGELIARLTADPLLGGAVDVETLRATTDRNGERLLIFVDAPVTSEASVAMQAALARALGAAPGASENESRSMSDAEISVALANRPASSVATTGATPTESGYTRWLWLAALILLGLEAMLRRMPRRTEETARVA